MKELPFTIRKIPCIFMSLGRWPYTCCLPVVAATGREITFNFVEVEEQVE